MAIAILGLRTLTRETILRRQGLRNSYGSFLRRRTVRGRGRQRDELVPMSERELTRLTGINRGTFNRFMNDPESSYDRTIDNLERALSDPRLRSAHSGARTQLFDSPRFTQDDLNRLEQPPGTQSFRIIQEMAPDEQYPAGHQGTGWTDIDPDFGEQAMKMAGDTNIVRVIFSPDPAP